jgi:hypothetical protein
MKLQMVIALTDDDEHPWGVYEWVETEWRLIESFPSVEDAASLLN